MELAFLPVPQEQVVQSALERFAADLGNAPETRADAEELLSVPVPEGDADPLSSVSSLKDERRQIMLRPISDESLFEFNRLTAELLALPGDE